MPMRLLLPLLLVGCGDYWIGSSTTNDDDTDAGPGEAVLSWDAPTTDAGGGALNDLAGYRVYRGTSSGAYDLPADVGNVTQHRVTGLSPATWYFAVTAYDASGNESVLSNEVSKEVR